MPRIDENSITVTILDGGTYEVSFDWTDDTTTAKALGYTLKWKTATMIYNPAMTDEELTAARTAAIKASRRPTEEETVEADLRARMGIKGFVRTDPNPPAPEPMLVRVVT